jgi:hypothetical protein
MIYRDEALVAEQRVQRLRAEVAVLRSRPETRESRQLRADLRRSRRELARARRRIAWLRHPVLSLLPASIVEAVVALGLAYAMLLTALIIGALAVPL